MVGSAPSHTGKSLGWMNFLTEKGQRWVSSLDTSKYAAASSTSWISPVSPVALVTAVFRMGSLSGNGFTSNFFCRCHYRAPLSGLVLRTRMRLATALFMSARPSASLVVFRALLSSGRRFRMFRTRTTAPHATPGLPCSSR